MAEHQAAAVHVDMTYDVVVNTTHRSAADCVRSIVQRIEADTISGHVCGSHMGTTVL